ncbi:MAG: D-xylose ABC transporter substrate-binding protein [Halanaerobium sp.]
MKKKFLIFSLVTAFMLVSSLTVLAQDITIGFSMDDLRLERWQHDRDFFVEKAEELGADVKVQSADGDSMTQLSQAENLITQGIDVLVVVPRDGKIMGSVVREAHANDVPVLAYDRMLNDSEVDYYISFDNYHVGTLQAEYLVDRKPEGKYFMLGGSPTDNNAQLLRDGQMEVIQPYVDDESIEIVGDQWVDGWSAEEALSIVENALTSNDNDIDAIVASNDSTAGGTVEALKEQGLDGEVLVSGQDADLAACQRVVEGTQTMTVYKPIKDLATRAAEVAVKMAEGEEIETDDAIDNGEYDVPSILLEPEPVDQENMVDTVIEDGFHELEEVYENVPEDEWPEE